jgi:hypothetical protein
MSMNSETENLSPQQSLEMITSMIAQAKGNMQKNSFFFLLWGWTIAIANLGVYGLIKFTNYPNPFIFWAVAIPSAIISSVYGSRLEKNSGAVTHLDLINKWIWIGFGITTLIILFFGKQINWQINPVVLTMAALPTFVTGVILKFNPLKYGGIAFWATGILTFLVHDENQLLIAAVGISLGYLVPGYALKNRKD